jgi:hypothetical protein
MERLQSSFPKSHGVPRANDDAAKHGSSDI